MKLYASCQLTSGVEAIVSRNAVVSRRLLRMDSVLAHLTILTRLDPKSFELWLAGAR